MLTLFCIACMALIHDGAGQEQELEERCPETLGQQDEEGTSILHLSKRKAHSDTAVATSTSLRSCARTSRRTMRKTIDGRSDFLFGKSIYFIVIDRFALEGCPGRRCSSACTGPNNRFANLSSIEGACGGTLRGIADKISYIKGMGFDCIWITPVVQNQPNAYMYTAQNLYSIEPSFGTEQDLKDLSGALHKQGMCLILDIAPNHMGLNSTQVYLPQGPADPNSVYGIDPFSKPGYYHTYGAKQVPENSPESGRIWNQYVSGSMNNQNNDTLYPQCCPVVDDSGSPTSADQPLCLPGDDCLGYQSAITLKGWPSKTQPDLDQSNPYVRRITLDWAHCLVDTYKVDAIRLDTAIHMPRDFLAELQEAVGVEILGEAVVHDPTFASTFQAFEGKRILDGLLNFPLFFRAQPAFCGRAEFPGAIFNLTALGDIMTLQQKIYPNPQLLGNFLDNHDSEVRIANACNADESRIKNAWAWLFLWSGVPILYYGDEDGFAGGAFGAGRMPLWGFAGGAYNTSTWQYIFIKKLNAILKAPLGTKSVATSSAKVVQADEHTLVFSRSCSGSEVWVYVNNLCTADAERPLIYTVVPPNATTANWTDVLSGELANFSQAGYLASDGAPKVLMRASQVDSTKQPCAKY